MSAYEAASELICKPGVTLSEILAALVEVDATEPDYKADDVRHMIAEMFPQWIQLVPPMKYEEPEEQ